MPYWHDERVAVDGKLLWDGLGVDGEAVVAGSGGKIRIPSSGREGAEQERRWEKEEEQRNDRGKEDACGVYVSGVTVTKFLEGVKVSRRRRRRKDLNVAKLFVEAAKIAVWDKGQCAETTQLE